MSDAAGDTTDRDPVLERRFWVCVHEANLSVVALGVGICLLAIANWFAIGAASIAISSVFALDLARRIRRQSSSDDAGEQV